MNERIGFIGLGNMGQGMAARLLAAHPGLTIYNRTAARAQALLEKGATLAKTPAEVASKGGIVCSILADDAAVRDVASDAFLAALGPGGVHVSHSTILPATAAELAARHAKHGVTYVAAPVFGRPPAAAAGQLLICTSGPADAKRRAAPVLQHYAKATFDYGDAPDAAHAVKVAGNFLILSAVEAMAEASAFAEKSGIPRAELLQMLTSTLFNCPIYTNYGKQLVDAEFDKVGFALPLALKDVGLVLETSRRTQTPMPLASLLRDRFLAAQAKGRGGMDTTAFALGAADDAGLSWTKKT